MACFIFKPTRIYRKNVTLAKAVTPHGLRHEHLNELYEKTTGHQSPVRGGKLRKIDKELDSFGRNIVAERAGHSREFIAGAYRGVGSIHGKICGLRQIFVARQQNSQFTHL